MAAPVSDRYNPVFMTTYAAKEALPEGTALNVQSLIEEKPETPESYWAIEAKLQESIREKNFDKALEHALTHSSVAVSRSLSHLLSACIKAKKFDMALEVAQMIPDKQCKAYYLYNLGLTHLDLKDPVQAKKILPLLPKDSCYKKSLLLLLNTPAE
jgi:hypothetical protein